MSSDRCPETPDAIHCGHRTGQAMTRGTGGGHAIYRCCFCGVSVGVEYREVADYGPDREEHGRYLVPRAVRREYTAPGGWRLS